jgi:hypothetical protein
MDQRQLYRRNLLRFACFGFLLFVIAILYVYGVLSPRGLGIACASASILFFFAMLVMLRRNAEAYKKSGDWPEKSLDEATRKSRSKTIRAQVRLVVILQLALWYGLWAYRANLSWPLLVGVVVNLCFTAALVRSILHRRSSLKLPDTSRPSGQPRNAD